MYRSPQCHSCGNYTVIVIETNQVGTVRRRRNKCNSCGHRYTTYEIHQDEYKKLEESHNTLTKIMALLQVDQPSKEQMPCTTCKYAAGSECSFGYPEYRTEDAVDCTMYEPSTKS